VRGKAALNPQNRALQSQVKTFSMVRGKAKQKPATPRAAKPRPITPQCPRAYLTPHGQVATCPTYE
jgi:hypothetical protein